jgi:hypothetical protein
LRNALGLLFLCWSSGSVFLFCFAALEIMSGAISGTEVLRVISKTTAAAIDYDLEKKGSRERHVVLCKRTGAGAHAALIDVNSLPVQRLSQSSKMLQRQPVLARVLLRGGRSRCAYSVPGFSDMCLRPTSLKTVSYSKCGIGVFSSATRFALSQHWDSPSDLLQMISPSPKILGMTMRLVC